MTSRLITDIRKISKMTGSMTSKFYLSTVVALVLFGCTPEEEVLEGERLSLTGQPIVAQPTIFPLGTCPPCAYQPRAKVRAGRIKAVIWYGKCPIAPWPLGLPRFGKPP